MVSKQTLTSMIVAVGLIAFVSISYSHDNKTHLYQQPSAYTYEDTLLNLDIAIAEHNYRITGRSHIGQALRDRG